MEANQNKKIKKTTEETCPKCKSNFAKDFGDELECCNCSTRWKKENVSS